MSEMKNEVVEAKGENIVIGKYTITPEMNVLYDATNSIMCAMVANRKAGRLVATQLRKIKNEVFTEVLEKAGFKDVFDYANKLFDVKKAQTYNLIAVANKFDGINEFDAYSTTQLLTMLNTPMADLLDMHNNNLINPQATVKNLKEIFATDKVIAENSTVESDEDETVSTENDGENTTVSANSAIYDAVYNLISDKKLGGKSKTDEFIHKLIELLSDFGYDVVKSE